MSELDGAPFRVQGVVEPPYFTDRADEVTRIRGALERPPSKLLVYGPRRMGKTSALHVARRGVERAGGAVVFADLSTVSSPADMANRVLEAATRALGRSWSEFLGDLASRLRIRLQLVPDPATGLALPSVEASLRSRAEEEQVDSFVAVLDALESMAEARDATLGAVLDEFQELHRFGGEASEWRLRGAIQHHQRIGYVLAGSDASLIRAMLGKDRAFYELFRPLHFGAMDPAHLARWLEERLSGAGVEAPGIGARTLEVAGTRTRDAVRLALAAWEVVRLGGGPDAPAPPSDAPTPPPSDSDDLVRAGLRRLVAEEDDRMRVLWDGLTEHQQNVLRAVAWNGAGLTTRETLERFALGHGGTARNTALALERRGLLVRSDAT
ncbi:MAG TPA: hypothetical protein VK966_06225, partial [Longimicrobiales bacterium]|nr:hypothetical protein [Longimicrobiales bacterium]